MLFLLSLVCRLILSAVIEGDRRDTAACMLGMAFSKQPADMRPIWRERLEAVEEKLAALPVRGDVDKARRAISEQCRAFAFGESGVYRLSVPTGSGKTLAGLRAALAHAAARNKARIFFVSPLLTILDQNAKVIKNFISDDSLILEHASNILRPEKQDDELDENELLTETWRAPIVVTTLVQFLNTLFDGRTACIRRMNALANSVIVLDEVQSVPRHMLSPFNMAVNFLSAVCGATVILCSATEPCLEAARHPVRLSKPSDLVAYDPALWQPFRRTEITDRRKPGGYTAEELAALALESLEASGSLLLICNKKDQAAALYRLLSHAEAAVYHLSTSMCAAHRLRTLDAINARLGKEPVVCVATQLVEAGVDFSFGCVIRVSAGLDNVVQAAGRCNRGGEFGRLCPVYIVNLKGENLGRLKEIAAAQNAAEELLYDFARAPAAYGDSLASAEAVESYYRRLFGNMKEGAQDYPLPDYHSTLFRMLGRNDDFRVHGESLSVIGQAFRTAGDAFQVFDDRTFDLLVPYGPGEALIADLCGTRAESDPLYRKELLEKAKPYSVSVFRYQLDALQKEKGIASLCGGAVWAVRPAFYREDTGLDITGGNQTFMEV